MELKMRPWRPDRIEPDSEGLNPCTPSFKKLETRPRQSHKKQAIAPHMSFILAQETLA